MRGGAAGRADAVVLGGGPAGAAAAMALAKAGAAVVLVERSRYTTPRVGETLAPAVRAPLMRMEMWPDFAAGGSLPSWGVRAAWGSEEPYERSFVFDAHGTGWHVDRAGFDAALATAAEARGVRVLRGARLLEAASDAEGGWALRVDADGARASIRARVVVDATGRASTFARRMGARRQALDASVAVVGILPGPPPERDAGGYTLIEAVREGWWYSAPLPGGGLLAAFMTDADLRVPAGAGDARGWAALLAGAPRTQERARGFGTAPAVRVACANSSRLSAAWGAGWLAVGDAAAAQDPLSGDGVVRALESGARAARCILEQWAGDGTAAGRYAARIDDDFDTYLRRRHAFYSREPRWPASPFWARRAHLPAGLAPLPNAA